MPRQVVVLGRDRIVSELAAHAREGHAVVIHGPRGCGASTILDAVARELSDRPIARVAVLRGRADLTTALAAAYRCERGSQRASRASAFDLAQHTPGVVLVDRIERGSAAVRGDIRALGAMGTGAVIAAEVNRAGDHARVRAMRLAHRELAIPPLDRGQLRRLLEIRLSGAAVRVDVDDIERLLRAADGRPGLIARMTERLDDASYWRRGRVLVEALRADVVAKHYEESR